MRNLKSKLFNGKQRTKDSDMNSSDADSKKQGADSSPAKSPPAVPENQDDAVAASPPELDETMVGEVSAKALLELDDAPTLEDVPIVVDDSPTLEDVPIVVDDDTWPNEPAGELPKTAPLPKLAADPAGLATIVAPSPGTPAGELQVSAASRCHIGAIRSRNEDSCLIFESEAGGQEPMPHFGLYIVADGMGGHHDGHEASRVVSRMVAARILERIYLPLIKSSPHTGNQEPIQDVMLKAVQNANQTIFNPNPERDSGTTLTAALVLGKRIYLTHVGDSRAYLLRDGQLEQITTDHTLVQRLQDAGQLSSEEAERHPHRNVLYRAVGQGGDLDIDVYTRTIPDDGKLLLCSDGLWGLVPVPLIREVLEQPDTTLEERADTLVKMALQAGGHDNITAVIVEFATIASE